MDLAWEIFKGSDGYRTIIEISFFTNLIDKYLDLIVSSPLERPFREDYSIVRVTVLVGQGRSVIWGVVHRLQGHFRELIEPFGLLHVLPFVRTHNSDINFSGLFEAIIELVLEQNRQIRVLVDSDLTSVTQDQCSIWGQFGQNFVLDIFFVHWPTENDWFFFDECRASVVISDDDLGGFVDLVPELDLKIFRWIFWDHTNRIKPLTNTG